MKRGIERRLRRLEGTGGEFADVMALVRSGAFYDQLSETQQRRYCQYRFGQDRHPEETLAALFGETFNGHFKLERKPPPPTREELEKTAKEVEEIVLNFSNDRD